MKQKLESRTRVFTIGHSTHSVEAFLQILARFEIEVLVDVRTAPYSKHAPQFNQMNLKHALKDTATRYLFLGKELGGMPENPEFYDREGHVLYWKMAESEPFRQGFERLKNGAALYRVALLCGEENPLNCHRHVFIGRALAESGIGVIHIRANGSLQSFDELRKWSGTDVVQMSLFSNEKENWKSAQPVLRKKQDPSASDSTEDTY